VLEQVTVADELPEFRTMIAYPPLDLVGNSA
jgi:hypothetical protein